MIYSSQNEMHVISFRFHTTINQANIQLVSRVDDYSIYCMGCRLQESRKMLG